jgi:hypothetical protein
MDIPTLASNAFTAIVNFLNGIPPEYWVVIVATIPVSGIIVMVKIWAQRKWDKAPSSTKMFLTNFFAIVAMAVAAYLSTTPTEDPIDAIATMVTGGLLVQQPIYFRFIKPIIKLAWSHYDEATALKEEMKSAAVEGRTPIE